MARLFHSGFELNSATTNVEWVTAGTPAISSATVRSGDYAGQITSLVSGTRKYFNHQFSSALANGAFYCRFYLRIATAPSANNMIAILGSSATGGIIQLQLTSSRTLRFLNSGTLIGSASPALNANTWYRIEILFDRTGSAGSHIARAYIDGVEFSGSSTLSIGSGVSHLTIGGNLEIETQTTGNWFFDDVAINNSTGSAENGLVGDSKLVRALPTGAGDNNQWRKSNGNAGDTDNFNQVNEVTPDDATTQLIRNATAQPIDDFNVTDSSTLGIDQADIIKLVAVSARIGSNSGTANGAREATYRIKGQSGGTVLSQADHTMNINGFTTRRQSTPKNFGTNDVAYVNPQDSSAWTTTTIDSMQIGIQTDTSTNTYVRYSSIWADVEFARPIAYDNASDSTGSGSTLTFSHTVSGTNRILLVGVAVFDSNEALRPVTSVTYNGVALTKIDDEDTGAGSSERAELWYLVAPATGANNVVITTTGSVTQIVGGAVSLTGVNQSSPVDAFASGNGSSGTATLDLATTSPDTFIVDVLASEPNITTVARPQNIRVEREPQTTQTLGMSTSGTHANSSTITHGYNLASSSRWRMISASIKPYLFVSSSDATATPSVATYTASVQAPTITAVRNVSISPSVQSVTASVQAPSVIVNASSLTDDFSGGSRDTSKWNALGAGGTQSGGTVSFTTSINSTDYPMYESVARYDLSGSYVFSELVDAGDQSLEFMQAIPAQVRLDAQNSLTFFVGVNKIVAQQQLNDVFTGLNESTTYDSAVHKFFRIRESGGTVYWEYSTNSTDWTSYYSKSNPFNLTSLQIQIGAGTWDWEASTSTVIIDNFNLESSVANATATPSVITVTSSVQNPTITAVRNATATPSVQSVVSSVQAPTITAVQNVTVSPSVQSIVASVQNPTVTTTSNATTTPSVQSIASSVQNPTITATRNVTISPSVQSIASSVQNPTITAIRNVTATPSVESVTASVQAPSITTTSNATTTPTTIELNATVQAPTITAIRNVTATPSVQSVVASLQAPTITAIRNVTATPSVSSLTASVQAPTVTTTSNATITPSVQSVVASLQAPTIATTSNVSITPSVQSVVASVQTPTVTAIRNVTATPSVQSLNASIQAPTITAIRNVTISPSVQSVVASVQAPSIDLGVTVDATVVSFTASVQSPSVSVVRNVTATPSVATYTATVQAPTVTTIGNATVTPSVESLSATVQPPTVTVIRNVTATPSVQSIVSTVQTVSISTAGNVSITPSAQSIVSSVQAPIITVVRHVTATPSVVSLNSSVQAPSVSGSANVSSAVMSTTATVQAPSVAVTRNVSITPSVQSIVSSVQAPSVSGNAHISPSTQSVTASVQPPTITAIQNVTATPSVAVLESSVQSVVVTTGANATVTPSVIDLTGVVNTVLVSGDATVQQQALQAHLNVNNPSITIDTLISCSTMSASFAVLKPKIKADGMNWYTPTPVAWQSRQPQDWYTPIEYED